MVLMFCNRSGKVGDDRSLTVAALMVAALMGAALLLDKQQFAIGWQAPEIGGNASLQLVTQGA